MLAANNLSRYVGLLIHTQGGFLLPPGGWGGEGVTSSQSCPRVCVGK